MTLKINIGILVFDEVEILDFAGPYEVFSRTRLKKGLLSRRNEKTLPFNIFTISVEKKQIKTTGGLIINTSYNINNCPKMNVLLIPGGMGTRRLLENKNILSWIDNKKGIDLICAVCTGALLLAKIGLLENRKATSHWGALGLLKKLSPSTQILNNRRYVYDGVFTSGGVSAGIDMSLKIVEKYFGAEVALDTAHYIEYPWEGK